MSLRMVRRCFPFGAQTLTFTGMTQPLTVDIPHTLGAEAARQRLERGREKLAGFIPGQADVQSSWTGDTLHLQVRAMGQEVRADALVGDTSVRLTVLLPPALSFFSRAIEAGLRRGGAELLEDKSGRGNRR